MPTRRLADGDELACIPPVSGGAGGGSSRAGDHRAAQRAVRPGGPGRARRPARDRRRRRDLRVRRPDPGHAPARRRQARRPRRPGMPGGRCEALDYEAHETMAQQRPGPIADEIADRFAVDRIAIVHRVGARAARRGQRGRRGRGRPSRRGLRGRPLRDRRAQGPGADLEGRAIRRRPCLDRQPGPDRTEQGGGSMKVYISVDMEGIAGISHPAPTNRGDLRVPGRGGPDGRRGERRDRRRLPGRGDRGPGQRQPRRDAQPAPDRSRSSGPPDPGPEGLVDGRRGRSGPRLRGGPLRRLSRPRRAIRWARSPTPTRAGRWPPA